MANNVDVNIIEFDGNLDKLKKDLKVAEAGFTTLETKAVKSVKTTEKAFDGMGQKVRGVLSALPFGHLVDDLDRAGDAARNLGGAVGGISGGASKASGGIKALTGIITGGLLLALSAVIVAFTAIVSYIKNTDEGAAKLEAVMAGLGASFDVVSGRLATLGSDLVNSENGFASFFGTVLKGIEDFTLASFRASKNTDGFSGSISRAFYEAERLSLQLDEIQDSMRLLSVETRAGELEITSLLKQTRNRGIDIKTRLDLVNQAQTIENENLAKNFDLQKKYYQNIALTNLLKVESINQDNKGAVTTARAFVNQIGIAKNAEEILDLYRLQLKAQENLRSISDEQAQIQVDGLLKLIELSGKSEISQEKFAAIQSQLIEKDIADRINGIKEIERTREATAINTIKNDEELADKTLEIQLASLEAQKAVLLSYNKDVSEIELQEANLRRKREEDKEKIHQETLKKQLEADKAYYAAQQKLAEDNFKKTIEDGDENLKYNILRIRAQAKAGEDTSEQELKATIGNLEAKKILYQEAGKSTIDIELELQAKLKQLREQGLADETALLKQKEARHGAINDAIFQTAGMFAQENATRQQIGFDNEINESKRVSQEKQNALQLEKEAGIITEAKYNASIKQLQFQQAQEERKIKIRQAQADKENAIFNIVLNTAQAVLKAYAQLGPLGGTFGAALAAGIGAIQVGLVASRPLPKFKDGVIGFKGKGSGTSDENMVMISNNESVMTSDETNQHKNLFTAIRQNKFDKYVNRAWVLPALEKYQEAMQRKDRRNAVAMDKISKMNNPDFDNTNLERAIRKNNRVSIANIDELGKYFQKGRDIV